MISKIIFHRQTYIDYYFYFAVSGKDKLKTPIKSLPSDSTTHLKGFGNKFINELDKGFKELKNEGNKKK